MGTTTATHFCPPSPAIKTTYRATLILPAIRTQSDHHLEDKGIYYTREGATEVVDMSRCIIGWGLGVDGQLVIAVKNQLVRCSH